MAEHSRYIPQELRRQVIERANGRCEYCRLAQAGQAATFHLDHITAFSVEGQTTSENLALACVSCSLRKSARQIAVDPQTGLESPIFNPRQQHWSEHFRWDDIFVVGTTPTGRATADALNMNRAVMLAIRTEEIFFHRHPPKD